jgi:hypothetical protein
MSFPEERIVEGRMLNIWGEEEKGYTISDMGGWIPGIYESKEAAIKGFKLSLEDFGAITELNDKVCNINKENRKITIWDIK